MKIQLEDLECYDFMYYVGDLIDVDGTGWVDEQTAIDIINAINNQNK